MGYEPATITLLSRVYRNLADLGVSGAWYGEAGQDVELAKLILSTGSTKEAYAYCEANGYVDDEEE